MSLSHGLCLSNGQSHTLFEIMYLESFSLPTIMVDMSKLIYPNSQVKRANKL